MTALDNQPSNFNILSQINFRFILKRAPSFVFFCTKCNVPGISLTSIDRPTPFVPIPVHGDEPEFEELHAAFMVDEDYNNFFEIYEWMAALGTTENFEQYAALKAKP